jgi:hypothetical protein
MIACLSLSMKLDETVKKLAEIYTAFRLTILGIDDDPDPKVLLC